MFNALFTKTDEYARLAQALGGPGACALFGIPGSGRAMVYAALAKALDKPLCIVTPGEAEATRFAGDLNALGVAAAVFPARDYVLRPIEGTGREYEYRRLAVLGDLVGGRLQAVCVPDEGLTQYTTPRADFCANTRSLRPGDTLPRAELTALLYGAGYTRRDQVDGPGQFSIRGDIADIYAPDMKQPARMEFWGDEIDTMHTFDLATQRRDEPIEKNLRLPRAGDTVRSARRRSGEDPLLYQKGPRQAAHRLRDLHRRGPGTAGRRRDARQHGQISHAALSRACDDFRLL